MQPSPIRSIAAIALAHLLAGTTASAIRGMRPRPGWRLGLMSERLIAVHMVHLR